MCSRNESDAYLSSQQLLVAGSMLQRNSCGVLAGWSTDELLGRQHFGLAIHQTLVLLTLVGHSL